MKTKMVKGLLLSLILVLVLGMLGCAEEELTIQPPKSIPDEILYIGGYNKIIAFDPLKLETIADIEVPGPVRDMTYTKNGHLLYANHKNRTAIAVIDTATQEVVDNIPLDYGQNKKHHAFGMTLSEDETKLYVNTTRSERLIDELKALPPQILEIDLATKEITNSYDVPHAVATLWAVENGEELIVVGRDVYKLNLATGDLNMMIELSNFETLPRDFMLLWSRPHESQGQVPFTAYALVFDEEMELADVYLEAYIVDLKTGDHKMVKLEGPPFGYFNTVYNPQKDLLYAAMNDLGVYDGSTGELLHHQINKMGTYYSINISPDGERLFLSGAGNDLSILDSETFEEIFAIEFDTDSVDARYVVRK